jgi:hypothetical protein
MNELIELPAEDEFNQALRLSDECEMKGFKCPVEKVLGLLREERTRLIKLMCNDPLQIYNEVPQLRQIMQRDIIKYGIVELINCRIRKILNL